MTVAGRDGAGRLGQESEELNIRSSASSLGAYSSVQHHLLCIGEFQLLIQLVIIQQYHILSFSHDQCMWFSFSGRYSIHVILTKVLVIISH